MNLKQKIIFIIWMCLVIGLVLFRVIYVFVNQIQVNQEEIESTKEVMNLFKEFIWRKY